MIISIKINAQDYQFDGEKPFDISIPLDFYGVQPNAYGVEKAASKPCEAEGIVGDTRLGGSCNFEQVKFIPHCNGTHTESVGHITRERISVRDCLQEAFSLALLITVETERASETGESYSVELSENDELITENSLLKALGKVLVVNNSNLQTGKSFRDTSNLNEVTDNLIQTTCYKDSTTSGKEITTFSKDAETSNKETETVSKELHTVNEELKTANFDSLVIRTLPNNERKVSKTYLKEIPPFFSIEAMRFIHQLNIKHLLVDLPSIDRIFDEGKLSNHRIFWNVEQGSFETNRQTLMNNTITELIYVPDEITDGKYLLNLQIAPFAADAAPSRPLIFKISE